MKEKLIPLTVSGARIKAIAIEFPEDPSEIPRIMTTACLILPNGEELSDISFGTASWFSGNRQFSPPIEGLEQIARLKRSIETAVHLTLNRMQKTIGVDNEEKNH